MKKAIAISLVALLLNSAGPFVFAQTLRAASDKDFNAAYDAQIRKTMATFPDLPSIAIVVIKDDRPIFMSAYGMTRACRPGRASCTWSTTAAHTPARRASNKPTARPSYSIARPSGSTPGRLRWEHSASRTIWMPAGG